MALEQELNAINIRVPTEFVFTGVARLQVNGGDWVSPLTDSVVLEHTPGAPFEIWRMEWGPTVPGGAGSRTTLGVGNSGYWEPGSVVVSQNGTTWSQLTTLPPGCWYGLTAGPTPGIFLAVGFDTDGNYPGVAFTTDYGSTWTSSWLSGYGTPNNEGAIEDSAYGNGRYVAVGQMILGGVGYPVAWYSDDGISWMPTTLPDENGSYSWTGWNYANPIVWHEGTGRFVVLINDRRGGNNVLSAVSSDGETWTTTAQPNFTGTPLPILEGGLATDGQILVWASRMDENAHVSTDGVTWISWALPVDLSGEVFYLCYGNGAFNWFGNEYTNAGMRSTNGQVWTTFTSDCLGVDAAVWDGTNFIGARYNDNNSCISMGYSGDGATWTFTDVTGEDAAVNTRGLAVSTPGDSPFWGVNIFWVDEAFKCSLEDVIYYGSVPPVLKRLKQNMGDGFVYDTREWAVPFFTNEPTEGDTDQPYRALIWANGAASVDVWVTPTDKMAEEGELKAQALIYTAGFEQSGLFDLKRGDSKIVIKATEVSTSTVVNLGGPEVVVTSAYLSGFWLDFTGGGGGS